MIGTPTPEKTTPAQRRQADARQVYRASLAAGYPLTGTELGAKFGLGQRWGQDRIAEVKREALAASPGLVDSLDVESLPPVTTPHAETAPTAPASVRPVQRRGASAVSWLAFGLGILISIAANVGHVHFVTDPADEIARAASMGMAALWPVLLAVAVEVVSRVAYPRGWRWWLPGYAATILVGVVAAIVSYQHMHGLLIAFGESEMTALLGPIAVDGTLIVGGFSILAIGETKKTMR